MDDLDVSWRAFALAVGAIATLRNGGDPARLGGFTEPRAAAAHLRGPCGLDGREAVTTRLRLLFEQGHSGLWLDLAVALARAGDTPIANLRFAADPGEWTQSHERMELVRGNPELHEVGLVAPPAATSRRRAARFPAPTAAQ